jgi:predicted DNA-binding protein (UPF0251 family)
MPPSTRPKRTEPKKDGSAGPSPVAASPAEGPVERILSVRRRRVELEIEELEAWRAGRAAGLSWLELATPLGITRSAAQQRLAALESRRGMT